MERYFEKISFEQFKKEIKENKELYEEYKLPKRSTKYSAGYDFYALEDLEIAPGEIKKIPTGYRAKFKNDEVLMIFVRSSMGFKYNVRLTNQVGIIDADYFDNKETNGHMYVSLQNEGNKVYKIKKGEAYAQGLFLKYLTCGEEVLNEREGWTGSPLRKEDNNE